MKSNCNLQFLRRRRIAFASAMLLAFVFGCGRDHQYPKPANDRPPDVVVIVTDTLRASHLSFYGYEEKTAPFLAQLAERSTVFRNAFSTSSWTAPATASIFTGQYPTQHGVTMGFFLHQTLAQESLKTKDTGLSLNRIPANMVTLPELFRAGGYTTFGITTNINIGPEIGFDRGFDFFERHHTMHKGGKQGADTVLRQLDDWEFELRKQRPKFIYLHFNDAHAPYGKRKPWYDSNVAHGLNPAISAYDSEISYLDHVLEQCFRKFGWDRDTIVIVISDHGEEFNDHGGTGHGATLYGELNRVLWLVYAPTNGVKAQVIDKNVSQIDLYPTLSELAGLTHPEDIPGRSLVPLLQGNGFTTSIGDDLDSRFLFAHRGNEPGDPDQVWSVTRGNWKLIEKRGGHELYDILTDRAERQNRVDEKPETVESLQVQLNKFKGAATWGTKETSEVEVDTNTLDALRELGYVE